MMKTWRIVAVGLSLIFLTGCTLRLVDFTAISTKNVRLPLKGRGTQRVEGKDCVFAFLIPFGVPNMKEAIDKAIESAQGDFDALVDGVVYQVMWPFWQCVKVEGTPINTKIAISMKDIEGKDLMLHSSQPGSVPGG